mgnify:CR=1 FL=1
MGQMKVHYMPLHTTVCNIGIMLVYDDIDYVMIMIDGLYEIESNGFLSYA